PGASHRAVRCSGGRLSEGEGRRVRKTGFRIFFLLPSTSDRHPLFQRGSPRSGGGIWGEEAGGSERQKIPVVSRLASTDHLQKSGAWRRFFCPLAAHQSSGVGSSGGLRRLRRFGAAASSAAAAAAAVGQSPKGNGLYSELKVRYATIWRTNSARLPPNFNRLGCVCPVNSTFRNCSTTTKPSTMDVTHSTAP